VADALATRGYWRLRGGRWKDAAADYRAARERKRDPFYVLGEAEARLQEGGPVDEVRILLRQYEEQRQREEKLREVYDELGPEAKRRPRRFSALERPLVVHAALLRWAASRREDDATERRNADRGLLRLYEGLPEGTPVVVKGDEDPSVRRLLCADARDGCVYDALESDSPAALSRLLGQP
jgi:hypothetical protein